MNLSLQREIGTQKKMYILFGQKENTGKICLLAEG